MSANNGVTKAAVDKVMKPFLFRKVTPNLINEVTAALQRVVDQLVEKANCEARAEECEP